MRTTSLDDVELLGDDGLGADELGQGAEVGQVVPDADEAEAVRRGVRDPVRVVGQQRKVLQQLLERRLRVEEVPDDEARDQNGPRAS
jgi:hypothetical protein